MTLRPSVRWSRSSNGPERVNVVCAVIMSSADELDVVLYARGQPQPSPAVAYTESMVKLKAAQFT